MSRRRAWLGLALCAAVMMSLSQADVVAAAQHTSSDSSGTGSSGTGSSGTGSSSTGSSGTTTAGDPQMAPASTITPNITETRRLAPMLPRRSGSGRRVVYSNSLQWVWVIDRNEQVVRSMPVSGRRGVPEVGTYRVTSQSPWSYSLDFEGVTFRWMTRFAKGPEGGNIGFHEIPRKDGKAMQTYAELGSFAGSGCVRMATHDVRFIYRWATPGTQVVVVR